MPFVPRKVYHKNCEKSQKSFSLHCQKISLYRIKKTFQLISLESTSTWDWSCLSLEFGWFFPIFTKMLCSVFFKCGSLLLSFMSVRPTKYDLEDSLRLSLFGFCNFTENFFKFFWLPSELYDSSLIEFPDLFRSSVPITEFVTDVLVLTKLFWSCSSCLLSVFKCTFFRF